ncbi:hypothetical protein ACFQ0B_65865 [Nonomuraea thailandensis]
MIAREAGSQVGERYALLVAARAHIHLRRFEDAAALLEEGAAMAALAGDLHGQVEFAVSRGRALIELGELETARTVLTEALEPSRATAKTTEMGCLVYLARAHRLLGQSAAAIRHSAEAVMLAEQTGSDHWLERAIKERDEAARSQPSVHA